MGEDSEIGSDKDVRSSTAEEKGNPLAAIFNIRHISKFYNRMLFYLEQNHRAPKFYLNI